MKDGLHVHCNTWAHGGLGAMKEWLTELPSDQYSQQLQSPGTTVHKVPIKHKQVTAVQRQARCRQPAYMHHEQV